MPVDRGTIDAQLREIGESDRWWEQREFRQLPQILHSDERILGVTTGKLLRRFRPGVSQIGQWLIVVTDQRLLCIKEERLARRQIEVLPQQITRMHQRSHLLSFEITIDTPLRRYRMVISKAAAFRFSGALRGLVPDPGAPRPPVARATERRDAAAESATALLPPPAAEAAAPPATVHHPVPQAAVETRPRRGVVSRFTRRGRAADPLARDPVERLQAQVDRLQDDVARLQHQVAFLEDLLRKQSDETFLARSTADT